MDVKSAVQLGYPREMTGYPMPISMSEVNISQFSLILQIMNPPNNPRTVNEPNSNVAKSVPFLSTASPNTSLLINNITPNRDIPNATVMSSRPAVEKFNAK